MKTSSLLAVSGAKYNRRSFDEGKPGNRPSENGGGSLGMGMIGASNLMSGPRSDQITSDLLNKGLYSNSSHELTKTVGSSSSALATNGTSSTAIHSSTTQLAGNMPNEVKYWRHPNADDTHGKEDLVVIHVCDENQQVSKDFCCRRDILVQHMRYFQKFLNETENGYDDIDISVHCDVEIFEWLMNYIHDTSNPPKMDKAILISILISSEFLQMDPLVELCVSQVSQSLNDIIKLPIDLSCISEKLVNRIASITSPKALSEIKDRKDKILTKLYKRRVELDFSRKGSASKSSGGGSSSSAPRTIAASLTCCRFCGWVYLENYSSFLTCRKSPPSIDHRGRLASRHSAIQGWSLTSYLKTLHSGGMGWDAIYWHVWAACIVLRVQDVVISALETDRYGVEPDGLLIKCMVANAGGGGGDIDVGGSGAMNAWSSYKTTVRGSVGSSSTTSAKTLEYALDMDMDSILSGTTTTSGGTVSLAAGGGGGNDEAALIPSLKMTVFSQTITSYPTSIPGITPTLNPHRPPEILTPEIYELVCGQMKYITGIQHKTLIATTMQNMVTNAAKQEASSSSSSSSSANPASASALTPSTMTGGGKAPGVSEAFQELQALDDDDSRLYYGATGVGTGGGTGDTGADEKRRGRSPARAFARLYSVSQEPRKGGNGGGGGRRSSTVGPAIPSQSSSAGGATTTTTTAAAAGGGVAAVGAASGNSSDNDATDTPYDSDADTPGGGNGGGGSGNGGSGGNGAAGTGRAKGTTRVHSHELQRQQQQQPSSSRPRSLSSAGKRSTSTNASSLTSASAKTGSGGGGGGPGLPPKGRGKLLANGTGGHGAASAAHGGLVMGDVDDSLTSDNPEQEHELALQRLHRILASMPPDLQHRAQHQQKGALYGVWLQPCALTWQPPAFDDMLCVVDESHLPDHKKLEWQLDLMREYDEKRMDKLERWLASKRNPAYDLAPPKATAAAAAATSTGGVAKGKRFGTNGQHYYKEKMRQPYKCVI